MKNRHFELRRRLARQYHRNMRRQHFDHGLRVRHDYSEVDPAGLSWWDDLQFILGSVRVSVSWRHPRHVYMDRVEDAAQETAQHLYDQIEGNLFDGAEKSYKKLGRSRKKAVSHTLTRRPGHDAWSEALRGAKARLSREADFTVAPSIKVQPLAWCRFVEIVAPIEVRSVAELRALADLVRRILRQETTLALEFPGYVYDKAQWVAEGLAARAPGMLSHRVAAI